MKQYRKDLGEIYVQRMIQEHSGHAVAFDTKGKMWTSPGADPSTLHILGSHGTSDDFDQLSSDDGLTGSVEENLVLVDHLTCILGGILSNEALASCTHNPRLR
jgi:hypothetical protein